MPERAVHAPTLLQGWDALSLALREPSTTVFRRSLLRGTIQAVPLEEACRLAREGHESRLFVELPS
jgi:hypothetical protein